MSRDSYATFNSDFVPITLCSRVCFIRPRGVGRRSWPCAASARRSSSSGLGQQSTASRGKRTRRWRSWPSRTSSGARAPRRTTRFVLHIFTVRVFGDRVYAACQKSEQAVTCSCFTVVQPFPGPWRPLPRCSIDFAGARAGHRYLHGGAGDFPHGRCPPGLEGHGWPAPGNNSDPEGYSTFNVTRTFITEVFGGKGSGGDSDRNKVVRLK